VLYLSVGGDLEHLHQLRDRVFTGPLERSLSWPFVPHVTVAEGVDADRIAAGLVAMASYRADVVIERVHVLEEQPGRSWVTVADYPMAAPAIVGRGGLALELVVSDRPDPESQPAGRFTVTARRDGAVVGSATVALEGVAATLT